MIYCDMCKVLCTRDTESYVGDEENWEFLPRVRHVCNNCDDKLMDLKGDVWVDFQPLLNEELARRMREFGSAAEKARKSLDRRKKRILKKAGSGK